MQFYNWLFLYLLGIGKMWIYALAPYVRMNKN